MRTKHLFYTAAMAALFAACVNDDFETIGQQGNVANDGRPVAGDVKLNFTQAGADTRLAFGSNGYAWEASDEIGALLMDNVKSLKEEDSWLQKYELIPEIHTSYRFYYDSQNEEWKADAKMLEGNYFFAYPWEDYDGRRQVAHSLINQEQDGIAGSVVAESYADNQFFIGYSQIKAGTGVDEVLDSSVEMVPLLGAIQLRITNTGTQTYHINKVVLSNHEGLASVLTFDPTTAEYGEWNLDENKVAWTETAGKSYFNYANYLGIDGEAELYTNKENPTEDDYVYNREDGDEYSRIEALRKVVEGLDNPEKSAQIVINGTADERAILPGVQNTAYVLIMCNPLEKVESVEDNENDDKNVLMLSIYTDEGFVQNIDLGKIYNESTENKVTTNAKITEVGPNVSNTITIQIDDNSFITPDKMDIFNNADLEQFIKWNVAEDATRNIEATLMQDITLTADMVEMLLNDKKSETANGQTTLTLKGEGDVELTLAADVPADVLDNEEIVLKDVDLVVKGELALTEDSEEAASIEVAKDGKLTIDDPKAVVADIDNYGTLTLGAKSAVINKNITIDNYGTMEVVKGGDSKATVTNKKDAVINNNGYMQNVTNDKDATIVLGENATLADVSNSGKIETAKGATVTGDNKADGEIVFVDGADISGLGTNNGKTSIVYDGTTITKDTKFENINKIILTKSVTVTDDFEFKGEVELQNNGVLSVNEGKTFTIGSLLVSGEGTVSGKGTVKVTTVEVEEETGALTNNGNIEVTGSFTNDGIVYNNGYVGIEGGQTAIKNTGKPGTWKYNNATNTTVDTSKQDAMDDAVATWASLWGSWIGSNTTDFYDGDPYDYKAFVAAVNGSGNENMKALKDALKAEGFTDANFEADEDKLVEPAEFATAVDEIVTDANWTALKKVIIDADGAFTGFAMPAADATLYDTEAEAYDAFAKSVAIKEITDVKDARVKAAIWKATDTDIADALAKTEDGEYIYIWKGCKLDEVMAVYRMISIEEWDVALHGEKTTWTEEVKTIANLKHWMSTVLNSENVNNSYVKKAKEVVEKYISEYQTWEYSDEQIKSAGK